MRNILIRYICLVFIFSSTCFAQDIYDYLSKLDFLKKSWNVTKTDYGLHLASKEKTTNPKGKSISSITIDIEDNKALKEWSIESITRSNIDNILKTTPINSNYNPKDNIGNGLGASIIDVNKEKVGYINYEVKAKKTIFARHALILGKDKLYTFTMIFFDPKLDRKKSMLLDMLVIATLNSDKINKRVK